MARQAMTAAEFRAALKALALRQAALADRLDVALSTVSRWATGDAPVPGYVAYVLQLLAERNEIADCEAG